MAVIAVKIPRKGLVILHPENVGLRAEINREHLAASMAAVHG
jgi:hypothetical protein